MLNALAGILLGWLSIEDIREKQVSIWPSVCMAAAGIILAAAGNETAPGRHALIAFLSGAGLGGAVWLAGKISRGSIGSGDAWVLGGLGAYLGWQEAVTVFFFGLVFCAAAGGVYVRLSGKGIKTEMPFIPFLTASYLVHLMAVRIMQ